MKNPHKEKMNLIAFGPVIGKIMNERDKEAAKNEKERNKDKANK
jgi:hypothetical protein